VFYMDLHKLMRIDNQFMYRWVFLNFKIIIDNQCVWICIIIICMRLLYNNCEWHFDEVGFCPTMHAPPLVVCHFLLSIGHLKWQCPSIHKFIIVLYLSFMFFMFIVLTFYAQFWDPATLWSVNFLILLNGVCNDFFNLHIDC
jgi:hypothetical protein